MGFKGFVNMRGLGLFLLLVPIIEPLCACATSTYVPTGHPVSDVVVNLAIQEGALALLKGNQRNLKSMIDGHSPYECRKITVVRGVRFCVDDPWN